uniref:SFRICE_038263 n=1 Tax=Spodoptera frugiperda TaxID=7108 RepID=A0A2H1X1C7_SPOFR
MAGKGADGSPDEPVGYVVDAVNVKNECYSNCRLRNNHGTHKYSTDITVARTHSINGREELRLHIPECKSRVLPKIALITRYTTGDIMPPRAEALVYKKGHIQEVSQHFVNVKHIFCGFIAIRVESTAGTPTNARRKVKLLADVAKPSA